MLARRRRAATRPPCASERGATPFVLRCRAQIVRTGPAIQTAGTALPEGDYVLSVDAVGGDMHPRAAEFVNRCAEQYGVDVSVEEFPEGTKTAADAAEAVGCAVGQIASSLAFAAGDDLVVVVTSGANRVSEERLATHLGVDTVTMADPDRIADTLGWSIGGVPPFCHDTAVPALFDETLLDYETVWAAAGTPEAVFPMAPDDIRRIADARVVDVTG